MPTAIASLGKQLADIAAGLVNFPVVPPEKPMEKALAKIKRDFEGIEPRPPGASMAKAIREFRERRASSCFAHLRDCCYGVAHAYEGFCLMEDDALFATLIAEVEDTEPVPRFRRCYQGLLWGYFAYQGFELPAPAGKGNWEGLRQWLQENLGNTGERSWIATLKEHNNLLGATPCARYAKDLLWGKTAEFEKMRESLGLDESTWVPGLAVLGQVREAVGLIEWDFTPKIQGLLDMLARYQTLREQGVALLLASYERCLVHREHPGLREQAVNLWGTPWLARNRARWDAWVNEPVRQMVTSWLNRQAIKDFFELLADDGATDRRRLQFWLRYADRIGSTFFALGNNARANRTVDFVSFRARNKDICLKLINSTASNNAFFMCVGDYVMIEFGKKGNAFYVFHRDNLGGILADRVDLDHRALRARRNLTELNLRHQDGVQTWEDSFARKIAFFY